MTTDILRHLEAGVLTLTFNRVDKKNAITGAMYQALADHLNDAADDTAVRVVVLQGHEAVFTAGNDLGDFLMNPPKGEDAPVFQFMWALHRFPKPVIAGVAGPAVGIGTTLLFHCDFVYCADNAAFSMPFVNLGLCPEYGASVLAPRLMGYAKAAEKLMLGEAFYADEAVELGLVLRVVPPHELNGYLAAQAKKLAAKPLSSLLATKALLRQSMAGVEKVIQLEAGQFARMLTEPAAKEAFSAFMEKRLPDFSQH